MINQAFVYVGMAMGAWGAFVCAAGGAYVLVNVVSDIYAHITRPTRRF